jgi:nicotinate phosphoribosyltransferase
MDHDPSDATPPDRAVPGLTGPELALFTDLYELTMLQAYRREGMHAPAVFSLFVRRLPPGRNVLLACGIDTLLDALAALRFDDDGLACLARTGRFAPDFLDWLAGLRFTGSVRAVAEGTPVFAGEPILEVTAPLPEAQLLETLVMNAVHLQTLAASKALRVVAAARGRAVVDFGMRRAHGTDAALRAARAFHIAGVAATSNVLAGRTWGVPLAGTMAHSYVQAHGDEAEAFRAFTTLYPDTTLLVDTYDTLDGVRRVIDLARETGDRFRVQAIRLDSGDLADLARRARALLDGAGLHGVRIFASGGLDEDAIAALLDAGAPIDAFGVGSAMAVSADAPALDIVYKLVEYDGRARLKLSTGKPVLPGPKQVWRLEADGRARGDVIGRAGEALDGRPLLRTVMRDGRRTVPPEPLETARARAAAELAALPDAVRGLAPAEPPYPVAVSRALDALRRDVAARAPA